MKIPSPIAEPRYRNRCQPAAVGGAHRDTLPIRWVIRAQPHLMWVFQFRDYAIPDPQFQPPFTFEGYRNGSNVSITRRFRHGSSLTPSLVS